MYPYGLENGVPVAGLQGLNRVFCRAGNVVMHAALVVIPYPPARSGKYGSHPKEISHGGRLEYAALRVDEGNAPAVENKTLLQVVCSDNVRDARAFEVFDRREPDPDVWIAIGHQHSVTVALSPITRKWSQEDARMGECRRAEMASPFASPEAG
jgi:hypothetical protein